MNTLKYKNHRNWPSTLMKKSKNCCLLKLLKNDISCQYPDIFKHLKLPKLLLTYYPV